MLGGSGSHGGAPREVGSLQEGCKGQIQVTPGRSPRRDPMGARTHRAGKAHGLTSRRGRDGRTDRWMDGLLLFLQWEHEILVFNIPMANARFPFSAADPGPLQCFTSTN